MLSISFTLWVLYQPSISAIAFNAEVINQPKARDKMTSNDFS